MSDYADNLKKSIVTTQGKITQMIHDDNEQTNAAYREAIIRMAQEADSGFEGGPDADGTLADSLVGLDAIERFAALVAAAEREACAEMVNHILKEGGGTWGDAVRKRGET